MKLRHRAGAGIHTTLLIAGTPLSNGCIEYNKYTQIPADTGIPDYIYDCQDCFKLHSFLLDQAPPWGDSGTPGCGLYGAQYGGFSLRGRSIKGFDVDAYDTSRFPGETDTRLAMSVADILTGEEYTWPDNPLISALLRADGSSGDWSVEAGPSDLGTLNTCAPNCGYSFFYFEINEQHPIGNAGICREFEPADLCVYTTIEDEATATIYDDSICIAGSGHFRLVPWRTWNSNGNDLRTAEFVPLQLTGTSALTASARILSISPTSNAGARLGVFITGSHPTLDNDDRVVGTVNRTPLAESPSIAGGQVQIFGSGRFFAEEISFPLKDLPDVEISWTCDAASDLSTIRGGQSYLLGTTDLGCNADLAQKFVIRTLPSDQPRKLHIEPYGNRRVGVDVPLTEIDGSLRFELSRMGLRTSGVWSSDTRGQTARIDLSEMTWNGIELCSPGSYSLGASD